MSLVRSDILKMLENIEAGRAPRLVLDKAPGKDIKQSAQCSGVSRRATQHLTAHLLGLGLGSRGLIH